MKANTHDYDYIYSVCVFNAAHDNFIAIKDVYDKHSGPAQALLVP